MGNSKSKYTYEGHEEVEDMMKVYHELINGKLDKDYVKVNFILDKTREDLFKWLKLSGNINWLTYSWEMQDKYNYHSICYALYKTGMRTSDLKARIKKINMLITEEKEEQKQKLAGDLFAKPPAYEDKPQLPPPAYEENRPSAPVCESK